MIYTCQCGNRSRTRTCSACRRLKLDKGPPQQSSMAKSHGPIEDDYGEESDMYTTPERQYDAATGTQRHNGRVIR